MYVPLDTDLDIILVLGAMYVAMLLTDFYGYILRIFRSCADNFYVVLRNFIRAGSSSPSTDGDDVYIGRSETAMWMSIISSWVCGLHYIRSHLAAVLRPQASCLTGKYDTVSYSGTCSCRT